VTPDDAVSYIFSAEKTKVTSFSSLLVWLSMVGHGSILSSLLSASVTIEKRRDKTRAMVDSEGKHDALFLILP
jgi:hypothetical protein